MCKFVLSQILNKIQLQNAFVFHIYQKPKENIKNPITETKDSRDILAAFKIHIFKPQPIFLLFRFLC